MSETRARGHLGGKGKSGSKSKGHVHTVHIRRAAGGGFISRVEREQDPNNPDMGQQPEEHVIPDQDQLAAHLQEHMGDQPPAGAAPEPQPQPTVQQ